MKSKLNLAIIAVFSLAFFSCNHLPIPEQFKIFKQPSDSDFQIETIERDKDNFEVLKDTVISANCNGVSNTQFYTDKNYSKKHINILFKKQASSANRIVHSHIESTESIHNIIQEGLKENYSCTIEYIDTCLLGVDKTTGKELVKVRKQLIVVAANKSGTES